MTSAHTRSDSFLYSCALDHHDLHSFPTRRSSDLVPERAGSERQRFRSQPAAGQHPQDGPAFLRGVGVPRARDDHPDRKSTRLNSSHGYSSYAVLCLKKERKNWSALTLTPALDHSV